MTSPSSRPEKHSTAQEVGSTFDALRGRGESVLVVDDIPEQRELAKNA